ncbi:hypothetical protein M3184_22270 [Metabacillus litoralis]|nr:hypothetical protein [Metabacillus litoralis]
MKSGKNGQPPTNWRSVFGGNITAAISKLGGNAALVDKVGHDQFGQYLIDVMNEVK